jgi:flagellar biosynthesis/type III secretory pathway protein FliH
VHAANTTAWKPLDFLALSSTAGQAFSGMDFRSQISPGFHRARIEAMPDNSLRAPSRRAPGAAPTALPLPAEAAPVIEAPAPQSPAESVLDEQAAERIRTHAFEEGLAQGRQEGEQAATQRLQAQIDAAREHGVQDLRDLMIQLGEAVASLQQQADTLHEPLKRLALHLAEELVLGQLGLDASAIDRLVQRSIDAIGAQGASQLVVELHPSDLAMLQQHPDAEADRPSAWVWQANEQLLPGSVRVRMNEAVVSDLIEHRLQALAKQLLARPQAWAAQSAFVPERLSERRRQNEPVEDARVRMGAPAAGSEERLPAWAMPSDDPAEPVADMAPAQNLVVPQDDALDTPDALPPEDDHA